MNLSGLGKLIKIHIRLMLYHELTELLSSETQTSCIYKPPT